MPDFQLSTRNSTFLSRTTMPAAPGPEQVLAAGVRSAMAMLSDEVEAGAANAAVEVTVHDTSGACMKQVVVSISVASLAVD